MPPTAPATKAVAPFLISHSRSSRSTSAAAAVKAPLSRRLLLSSPRPRVVFSARPARIRLLEKRHATTRAAAAAETAKAGILWALQQNSLRLQKAMEQAEMLHCKSINRLVVFPCGQCDCKAAIVTESKSAEESMSSVDSAPRRHSIAIAQTTHRRPESAPKQRIHHERQLSQHIHQQRASTSQHQHLDGSHQPRPQESHSRQQQQARQHTHIHHHHHHHHHHQPPPTPPPAVRTWPTPPSYTQLIIAGLVICAVRAKRAAALILKPKWHRRKWARTLGDAALVGLLVGRVVRGRGAFTSPPASANASVEPTTSAPATHTPRRSSRPLHPIPPSNIHLRHPALSHSFTTTTTTTNDTSPTEHPQQHKDKHLISHTSHTSTAAATPGVHTTITNTPSDTSPQLLTLLTHLTTILTHIFSTLTTPLFRRLLNLIPTELSFLYTYTHLCLTTRTYIPLPLVFESEMVRGSGGEVVDVSVGVGSVLARRATRAVVKGVLGGRGEIPSAGPHPLPTLDASTLAIEFPPCPEFDADDDGVDLW
ncbi:uncharacterized protein EV422DRAFT_215762 [Fimicolochytrium jonesii]|uniref:uncharacterized protein n=1 Tax=Fimicolochytrium jonesii TaxID=1396493 RepID=UPI0022FEB31C|nr:uncharacterized protein EV422DRAFT_215762 [Fimicolochytrium jonesii]KAI8817504.1 hypothetical protein EV422DRAFT_215762 [Fimicolochytrium jonesii]